MGEAQWLKSESIIRIYSDFYFYGDAASQELAEVISIDIANHWNEPAGIVIIKNIIITVILFIF